MHIYLQFPLLIDGEIIIRFSTPCVDEILCEFTSISIISRWLCKIRWYTTISTLRAEFLFILFFSLCRQIYAILCPMHRGGKNHVAARSWRALFCCRCWGEPWPRFWVVRYAGLKDAAAFIERRRPCQQTITASSVFVALSNERQCAKSEHTPVMLW